MKNTVLILCVNYNSYKELHNYMMSIQKSSDCYNGNLKVDVMIADNTPSNFKDFDTAEYESIDVTFKPYHENLGYMGGVTRLIEDKTVESVKQYDYVIVSNVDLLLSKTFFSDLYNCEIDENVGWLAPKIFSKSENRDRNPKMLGRTSGKKLEFLLLLFKFPFLYQLYTEFIYKLRNKKLSSPTKNKIYAGHGSLMIFTKSFMKNNASLKFPSFLFGEEIYFGELARQSKLDVLYLPQIVVHDIDHVSTGKMKRKDYCRMNYESLSILKEKYWNE